MDLMDVGNMPATQDHQIKKAFGLHVKELRKKLGWMQKELAQKVSVSPAQINKYEGGFQLPSADTLVELAEVLNTTVDFLLTGDRSEATPLHNVRLLERFRALQDFEVDDQEVVIKVIDALVAKRQIESALKPFDKRSRAR